MTPLSTCDWPGKLVATVFCQGCPWACGYCHNPDLIDPHVRGPVRWSAVTALLRRRAGLLDGVVFSGGEPTLQPALPDAIREVKDLGFSVGIHTSGAYPDRLDALLRMVDWVALDIKAPAGRYVAITGNSASAGRAFESLARIIASGIDHEIRTTVDPSVLDGDTLAVLADELVTAGVRTFAAQRMRRREPTGATAPAEEPSASFLTSCAARFPSFTYRSAA